MEEKVFYLPGEVVTLRQDIPYKPKMIVVKKETMTFRPSKDEKRDDYFIGIRCRWFSTEGGLQEAVFNTKDLLKVE
mgnify:FL=1